MTQYKNNPYFAFGYLKACFSCDGVRNIYVAPEMSRFVKDHYNVKYDDASTTTWHTLQVRRTTTIIDSSWPPTSPHHLLTKLFIHRSYLVPYKIIIPKQKSKRLSPSRVIFIVPLRQLWVLLPPDASWWARRKKRSRKKPMTTPPVVVLLAKDQSSRCLGLTLDSPFLMIMLSWKLILSVSHILMLLPRGKHLQTPLPLEELQNCWST